MDKLASSGENSLCKRFPKYIQCDGVLHNDLSAPPPSSTFQALSQRTYYFLPIQLASKVYVVYFKPVCEINFCHGDQSIMRSHNLTCRMDLLQSSKVKTRMVTHKYIFEIYSIVNPTTGNDFFIALAMVPSFFINCIHTRNNQLF